MSPRRCSLLLVAASLGACAPGEGVVEVTAWGEQRATQAFETTDGWTVQLEHWVTAYRGIRFSDPRTDEPIVRDDAVYLFDAALAPDPVDVAAYTLPAGRVQFGFDVVAPDASAQPIGDVDAALVDAMRTNGWSTWIGGVATSGSEQVRFAWGLDLPSRYDTCRNGRDGTDGVAVIADRVASVQLTLHVDHAFWSALGTEEAPLRFQALADADAAGDGLVDNDDLRAVDTIDIGYETSGLADDLYGMVAYSVAVATHVNGDGLCVVRSL